MRMRRALAWLFALCCIWSSLCSAAFAVDAPDLDDLGIDPWGDLGQLPDTVIQTPDPELAGELDGLIQDQIGGGEGTSFLSLDGDGSYAFTPTVQWLQLRTDGTTGHKLFSFPYSSIPSGVVRDNVSSSSYLVASTTVTTYTIFAKDTTLTGTIDVPTSMHYLTIDGDISFNFAFTTSTNSSYKPVFYPDKPVFNSLELVIGGVSFGTWALAEDKKFHVSVSDVLVDELLAADSSTLDIKWILSDCILTDKVSNIKGAKTYIFFGVVFNDDTTPTWKQSVSSGGVDSETKGLLGTIIGWLTQIRDGILSIPTQIVVNLTEGLKSLFVPSAEEITAIKESYEDLLSERLGFIWQAGEWITSFGSDLLSALSGGAEAEFLFPGVGFDMNGEHYQLIEQQAVDFDSNGIVTVIRPFVGTIVAFVVVIACVNLFHDMVAALISGKNYFDFLKGGGDG